MIQRKRNRWLNDGQSSLRSSLNPKISPVKVVSLTYFLVGVEKSAKYDHVQKREEWKRVHIAMIILAES